MNWLGVSCLIRSPAAAGFLTEPRIRCLLGTPLELTVIYYRVTICSCPGHVRAGAAREAAAAEGPENRPRLKRTEGRDCMEMFSSL